MNWTQIFRENLNCYALSIFRVFILLASSDSDKHMLMRQKVQTKICLCLRDIVKPVGLKNDVRWLYIVFLACKE